MMKRDPSGGASWRRAAAGLLALFTLVGSAAADEFVRRVSLPQLPSFLGYAQDRLVVEFKAEVRGQVAVTGVPGRPVVNLPSVQAVLDAHGAQKMEREFTSAKPQGPGAPAPDLTGYYVVRFLPGQDLEGAFEALSRDPNVDHVEKVGIHTVDLTPNDVYYQYGTSTFAYDQWHYWDLNGIDSDLGWNKEIGDPNVAVGILDTGIKYRHTDLGGPNPPGPADNSTNGNVWVNSGEIPSNGIDDDANGKVDDVVGWDFVDAAGGAGITCLDADCGFVDNDPNDGNGHGTHVAGTVAAITNNARAVSGIAGGYSDGTTAGAGNGCKVIPVRMGVTVRYQGQTTGIVYMDWAAQAMDYIASLKDHGVNVAAINCSWGSDNSGGITAAVANLVAHDVMIFNSAGNSNVTTQPYLCSLPGVTAVGATDSTGAKSSFSNHGSWVDISAPGSTVMSTYHDFTDPDTTHMYVAVLDGTSMSSPHCVGVAALLESYNPSLTAAQKLSLMTGNAFVPPGFPADMGAGIVNANLALAAAPPPTTAVGDHFGPSVALSLRAFPNPTRSGSSFLIGAPAGADVRLTIADITGRRVRELSGAQRLRWDGNDANGHAVAAGLYLVTARLGAASVTTRLAVIQ